MLYKANIFVTLLSPTQHDTNMSTLAVLQLDAILQNARLCFVDKPKLENKQQSKFEKMLGLELLLKSGHRWRGFVHVRKPI